MPGYLRRRFGPCAVPPPAHRYVITKLFSNPQRLRRLSPKTALKVESKKANVFFVRRPALGAGLLREVWRSELANTLLPQNELDQLYLAGLKPALLVYFSL